MHCAAECHEALLNVGPESVPQLQSFIGMPDAEWRPSPVQVRAAAQVLFDTKHFLKDYSGTAAPPGWDGAAPCGSERSGLGFGFSLCG